MPEESVSQTTYRPASACALRVANQKRSPIAVAVAATAWVGTSNSMAHSILDYDTDTISLTSTAQSEQGEDKVYDIDELLSEGRGDDRQGHIVKKYLVKWEGYDMHRYMAWHWIPFLSSNQGADVRWRTNTNDDIKKIDADGDRHLGTRRPSDWHWPFGRLGQAKST